MVCAILLLRVFLRCAGPFVYRALARSFIGAGGWGRAHHTETWNSRSAPPRREHTPSPRGFEKDSARKKVRSRTWDFFQLTFLPVAKCLPFLVRFCLSADASWVQASQRTPRMNCHLSRPASRTRVVALVDGGDGDGAPTRRAAEPCASCRRGRPEILSAPPSESARLESGRELA